MNKTAYGSVHQRDFDRPFWLNCDKTYLGHLGIFLLPPLRVYIYLFLCGCTRTHSCGGPKSVLNTGYSDVIHFGFFETGSFGGLGFAASANLVCQGGSQGLSLLLLVIKARASILVCFKKWILMIQHRSLYLCGRSATSWVKSQPETCIAQPSCIKARFYDWVILLAWEQKVAQRGAPLSVYRSTAWHSC